MKSNKKSQRGGYRAGAGRPKNPNPRKTKSVRIPAEITKDDLKLLTKYKNYDLPLYNMEIKDGVSAILNKEKYEIHKADEKLLVKDIENHFLVKVADHHMKESGILHNDILLVDRNKKLKHNSIVVAVNNNGDAVIKRLVKDGNKIILTSNNNNCTDIELDESSINIIWGIVIKVIRDY